MEALTLETPYLNFMKNVTIATECGTSTIPAVIIEICDFGRSQKNHPGKFLGKNIEHSPQFCGISVLLHCNKHGL